MTLATRFAFGNELIEIAKKRDDFLICSADTKTCGIEHFGEMFPGREITIGIAEQNLMGTAAGLASCGNKVFVVTFAVFATMRACEQVRTFVCYPDLNVTIIGTHTGLQVGEDGATHAAIEDVSIMRAFPNMAIVQPADAIEAREIARFAVDFKKPLYVRLHRNPVPDIYDDSFRFEFNKTRLVADYGNDITFIVSGILLRKAIEAAKVLKDNGINAKILEIATIKPIDSDSIIKCAQKTGAVITIEDHTILGGLGSAVAEILSENYPTPMFRIGIQDRFASSGDPELLYKENHMSVDDIIEKAHILVNSKRFSK